MPDSSNKLPEASKAPNAYEPPDAALLELLICPVTGSSLSLEDDHLVSACGQYRYPIKDGIAVLVPQTSAAPAQDADVGDTADAGSEP